MEKFQESIQKMRQKMRQHISTFWNDITKWHVDEDAKWDVKLEDGETPVTTECDDTTFCLRTKEGFFINISFGDNINDPVEFLNWIPLVYKKKYKDNNHESVTELNSVNSRDNWGPVQVLQEARNYIEEMRKPDMDKLENTLDNLHVCLHIMREHFLTEGWVIKDAKYWNVDLEKGETLVATKSNDRTICLRTEEGFFIRVRLMDFDLRNVCWTSYIHDEDYNVLTEQYHSYKKRNFLGPVQVLHDARNVVKAVEIPEIRMYKKRKAIDGIREELMMKACHPKRITVWADKGFDPFE
jgi:hypothetical protein